MYVRSRKLALLAASRRYMAAGLLCSVVGGFVGQGIVPGAVAASAIAIVWIAVLNTVETVEDLSSVVVGRLLSGLDPGRLLVAAEAYTCVAA